jgi:hypothetical protein
VTHLGDRVAAFVDGQLTAEAVDRATIHLVSCRPCRDLVELERLTKARVSTLVGPPPTADLMNRLIAMRGPAGPLPPRPGHMPGTPRPQFVPLRPPTGGGTRTTTMRTTAAQRRVDTSTRPSGRPAALLPRRRRLAAAVLGALSVVGVGVTGVAVGTSAAGSATPLSPSGRVASVGTSDVSAILTGSSTAPIPWFRTAGGQDPAVLPTLGR